MSKPLITILTLALFWEPCPRTLAVEQVNRDYWPTDGWKTGLPEEHGFNTNALSFALEQVPRVCPQLHSLLVVRHGRLVVERYFDGTSAADAWNVKSASKSILSALVGIALERGYIHSLDQPVIDFFPELEHELNDPRKKSITIRHLLTMSAGLEWTENGAITFRWIKSRNRVGFTWKSKLIDEPGSKWNYSTALTHMLSAVITRATGTDTLAFAQSELLGPIGATITRWDKAGDGYYIGGSEMYLTPRDMAKFGYLYLNNGQWAGKQVVPAAWVGASTLQTNNARYGFLWWLDTFEGRPVYFAQGLGGQHIIVVPSLDIVVVTTAYLPTHISALSFAKLWLLPCINHFDNHEPLPPAEQVIGRFYEKIGGRENLDALQSLSIEGALEIPARGEQGSFELLKGGNGKIYSRFDGTKSFSGAFGSDGRTVWTSWLGYRTLTGGQAQPWKDEAQSWSDLRGPVDGMKTVGIVSFAEHRCHELQSKREGGDVISDFYDCESGLLIGSIRPELSPYGWLAYTWTFADYHRFGALQFPTSLTQDVQGPELVLTRTSIGYNNVKPARFALPIPIADILKGRRNNAK